MTIFEKELQQAQEYEKIIYYDYLSYKRAAGWWTGPINNDDWNRPTKIQKANYTAEFLQNLPNYYFLGLPIKELLKYNYSNGHCHACSVALSLCFKDFEVITCNLQNYLDYYTITYGEKVDAYEHTFLLIYVDNKKTVIDTTFGCITDFETYKTIFNPTNISVITSKQLNQTKPYQYIKSFNKYIAPPIEFIGIYDDKCNKEQDYQQILNQYINMCDNYTNTQNNHLEDFISRCLRNTSDSYSLWKWRNDLSYPLIGNTKYEYPQQNLCSLTNDESDKNLYSPYENTNSKNNEILLNYHQTQIPTENTTNSLKPNTKIKILSYLKKFKI